jgi:hypothetical protein
MRIRIPTMLISWEGQEMENQRHRLKSRDCIQRETWCMGPYARVDLNPMQESTSSSNQGLVIWPLQVFMDSQKGNYGLKR